MPCERQDGAWPAASDIAAVIFTRPRFPPFRSLMAKDTSRFGQRYRLIMATICYSQPTSQIAYLRSIGHCQEKLFGPEFLERLCLIISVRSVRHVSVQIANHCPRDICHLIASI